MPPINNITILGGGLTGLTLAYRLSRLIPTLPALAQTPGAALERHTGAHRDTKITLIEKSPRIGGWVNSSNEVVKVPKSFDKGKGREQQGDEEMIDVKIALEAGPRSIRPKGSAGAAYMLKLVSIYSRSQIFQSLPSDIIR
jgi:oxygen-dependent protoporphyrinogen oxidase